MPVIHLIAAARPNFMKIAPLYHWLAKTTWANPVIVHTGQHYDLNMSDAFFRDLELPAPHIHLGIGSGTHAEHTGRVMIAYEKVCVENRPDLVVVVGDVNSTVACALATSKLGIPVAHLEAGLRSFDRTMPEEINRVVTDAIADVLWTPSPEANENLLREGREAERIEQVGNIMIDSLEMIRPKIERDHYYTHWGLEPRSYYLVTLHRPSNVDDLETVRMICETLKRIGASVPILFPVHPRTRKNLLRCGIDESFWKSSRMVLCDPLPYREFMNLLFNARGVITDSGGLQEETSFLGIPCLTLRPNTERPITLTQGTNRLVDVTNLEFRFFEMTQSHERKDVVIEGWDGKTAERVVLSISKFIS